MIAGNICTDMLRRRSRSTPTDDLELTAQRPVGVVGEDTSEELVLAAVDGELVNRALDRLSTRHRHVLAMREGSGWTYQQIADHEGVEIGTIETLLWRARQALKREFAVVSESKEALAGFLVATGALIRRTVFQWRTAAQRCTTAAAAAGPAGCATPSQVSPSQAQPSPPHSSLRTHCRRPRAALHRRPGRPWPLRPSHWARPRSAHRTAGARGPMAPAAGGSGVSATGGAEASENSGSPSGSNGSANTASGGTALLGGALPGGSSGAGGVTGGLNKAGGGLNGTVSGATGGLPQTVSGVTGAVGQTVTGVTSVVGQTVSGVTGAAGSLVAGTPAGVTSGVNGLTQAVGLGNVLSGTSSSGVPGSASSPSAPTTTTTNPVQGVVSGTTKAVGGLLGG